jgi:hypothetical protein
LVVVDTNANLLKATSEGDVVCHEWHASEFAGGRVGRRIAMQRSKESAEGGGRATSRDWVDEVAGSPFDPSRDRPRPREDRAWKSYMKWGWNQ